jgi:hypothetical protein
MATIRTTGPMNASGIKSPGGTRFDRLGCHYAHGCRELRPGSVFGFSPPFAADIVHPEFIATRQSP